MTAPVDTPDPGRYPDGNRIIAQTLHDAHGSGVATAPEPLALFAEQYDANSTLKPEHFTVIVHINNHGRN